jgi:hypothetical protein
LNVRARRRSTAETGGRYPPNISPAHPEARAPTSLLL